MAKTLDAVIRLTDNFSAKMERIAGSTEKFSRISQAANAQTNMLTSNLGKIAGVAAGAFAVDRLAEGLKGIAEKGIEGAASLEGYRNTLNVVMGDQKKAAETFKWAVDFANKTPFETDEVVEATVKLQSYGLVTQDVIGNIGDMAGVMNKSLDQAVEAVADAQNGELERLKEFGISKQQIIDEGNKIMKGHEIVNKKGQIVDQKNFNKSLFALMQERFKGGMDLQANSYKGLMSTVTGVYGTALAQIMGISNTGDIKAGSIFDKAKQRVKALGDTMQKLSDDGTFEKWGNKATEIFTNVEKVANDQVIPVLKDIASYGADALKWVSDHESTVKRLGEAYLVYRGILLGVAVAEGIQKTAMLATSVASGIETAAIMALYAQDYILAAATGAATAAQWLFNLAMDANPIALFVIAIGGIVAVLITLAKQWDVVSDAIKKAWEWLTTWNGTSADEKTASYGNVKAGVPQTTETTKVNKVNGKSRAMGEKRVPRDGELYTLHQGEEVLTARESRARNNGASIIIPKLADTIIIREDADIDKLATALASKINEHAFNM